MLNEPFFTTQCNTLIEYLIIVQRDKKIVGPSACPGERAHDVTLLWSLQSQTEHFFTISVENCTLLGVPVNSFYYPSLFMIYTENYNFHLI